MKKYFSAVVITFFLVSHLSGQSLTKQTYTYATKDTFDLQLDFYPARTMDSIDSQPCVIFLFGGAFVSGHRDDTIYYHYFKALVDHGYSVASISYRLGLKGVAKLSPMNTAPLKNAIDWAVEDLYDATNWLILHADELQIDISKLILSGSSSGAVTVLEADFLKKNNKEIAGILPPAFNYAGVVAFSGAVLSYDGKLKYQAPPAPTLLFHGTADKIVPYTKIKLFKKGLYGSSYLAALFREKNYCYTIFREARMGHEISVLPMYKRLPLILDFLDNDVLHQKHYQADIYFNDPTEKPMLTIPAKALFEKLSKME